MKDINDQIAVDKFKDGINEKINYIIEIAYTAGKIAGMSEQIEKRTPTCEGCIHYNENDQSARCFDCDRMIREDLYNDAKSE